LLWGCKSGIAEQIVFFGVTMKGEFSDEGMEFLDMRMRVHCEALRQRLEEEFGARLAKLESLFFDQLEAIEATLAAQPKSQGQATPSASPPGMGYPFAGAGVGMGFSLPPQGGGAGEPNALDMCRSLTARLSLLEESFARICNVIGRTDQELEMLREDIRNKGKG
jgi:hypothetical protein